MPTKKEAPKKEEKGKQKEKNLAATNQTTASLQHPLAKAPTQQLAKLSPSSVSVGSLPHSSTPTRVTIKYDVGFPNQIYIRGEGANLNWEQGILLKNVQTDEWVWETTLDFQQGQFKVLINDEIYEGGENHPLVPGTQVTYTPHFG